MSRHFPDVYRPGNDNRDDRNGFRARDEIWRRDQAAERRGRRFSDGPSRDDAERSRSPEPLNDGRTPQRRIRSQSHTSTRRDMYNEVTQPQIASRQPSGSAHSVSSPLDTNLTLSSNRARNDSHLQQVDKMVDTSSKSFNQVNKAADPRLRTAKQRAVAPDDLVPSAVALSTEASTNGSSCDQASLVINAVATIYRHHELKLSYERLRKQLDKQKGDYNRTQKMFPDGNAYVEKLREEYRTTESALEKAKGHMALSKKRQESEIQTFNTQNKIYESMALDVQALKDHLTEEQTRSKQLEESNEGMRQHIAQLTTVVQRLSDRFEEQENNSAQSHLQEQIDALKKSIMGYSDASGDEQNHATENRLQLAQLKEAVGKMQDQNHDIRMEVKENKLRLAQLDDVFVPQNLFEEVSTRLADIDARVKTVQAKPPSSDDGLLTQADLQQYVLVFNSFQDRTEGRINTLENKRAITASNLEPYAMKKDLQEHRKDVSVLHQGQSKGNARLDAIEHTTQKLADNLQSVAGDTMKLQGNLDTTTQQLTALAANLNRLKVEQQSQKIIGSRYQTSDQLKNDVRALQSDINRVDLNAKSQGHAIGSLNQRFNNLTTDQLCRQMVSTVEPMLSTIKPQVTEIHATLREVRSIQEGLQNQQTTTASAVAKSESQLSGLRLDVDSVLQSTEDLGTRVSKVEESQKDSAETLDAVGVLQKRTDTLQGELVDLRVSREDFVRSVEETLQPLLKSTKDDMEASFNHGLEEVSTSTASMIEQGKQDQQASLASLVDQVKEARDGIDARLVLVERIVHDTNKGDAAAAEPSKTQDHVQHSDNELGSDAKPPSLPGQTNPTTPASRRDGSESLTGKRLQVKSNTGSKTTTSKPNRVQASSLAKHFNRHSGLGVDPDTIDATPHSPVTLPPRAAVPAVIQISDSEAEQEMDDDAGKQLSNNSSPDDQASYTVNLDMWKKKFTPQVAISAASNPKSAKVTSARAVAEAPVPARSSSQAKRKRELSDVTPSSGRTGSSSRTSTPRLSQSGRKKRKT